MGGGRGSGVPPPLALFEELVSRANRKVAGEAGPSKSGVAADDSPRSGKGKGGGGGGATASAPATFRGAAPPRGGAR